MGSAPADNPSEVTSIGVQYKHAEGWHVFFSDDLPGLYVASEDPRKAYDDIAPAIEKLIKLDTGVTVTAEPQLSFEQWLQQGDDIAKAIMEISPTPVSWVRAIN